MLLDTNLLLYWIVGLTDRRRLGPHGHKRLTDLPAERFVDFQRFLALFPQRITTPHILTECSNLGRQASEPFRSQFSFTFERILSEDLIEVPVESRRIEELDQFTYYRFGLTDGVILLIADRHPVLTNDVPLANELRARGIQVFDFEEALAFGADEW